MKISMISTSIGEAAAFESSFQFLLAATALSKGFKRGKF
jgi:hypothetical protein